MRSYPVKQSWNDVLHECDTMIKLGSKSFSSAARIFDPPTRNAVILLYGWCRYCDDQIDGQSYGHSAEPQEPAAARARLEKLVEQTRAAVRGCVPEHPVFAAFQYVVQRYGIEERFPLELLKGLEMDVLGLRYNTLDDLLLYCYRVAGTVGMMMARVIGASDKHSYRHAVDLGIAMQLTNIARDVVDDARVGRVYLPLEWLDQAGLAPERLTAPEHREALAGLVRRLLEEAKKYYASGDQGLRYLPWRSACAVAAAREVYNAIGTIVEKRGAKAWDRRVVVPRARKLLLTARGFARVLQQWYTAPQPKLLLPSPGFLQPDHPGE